MNTQRIQNFFEDIVRPRMQILAMVITSLFAVLFAYYSANELRIYEPWPQLLAVTPDKVKEWGSEPVPIKVGLHIVDLPQFDLVSNVFRLDGIIWFEFDFDQISLETISKFTFEKGDIKKISKANTRLIGKKLFAEYKIKLEFTSNLSQQFFPIDDHRIFITLINTHVTPREAIFVESSEGFTLSQSIFTMGWTIMGHGMRTGYAEAVLDKHDKTKVVRYPKAIFYIDFSRSGVRQILLVLLPLFLMFFIGLFSFSFDPKTHASQILGLSSASVSSMIAYRFVIQSMSPKAGYFMLSDHIFTMFLMFAFISFVLGILIIRKGEITPALKIIRGVMFLMFHISFLVAWYYLLFIW
jgi:hypothetical protein